MSFSLEQIVNILLDIGIDNVNDMNNIIYLYQQYGIQVYSMYFIEDLEFIIIEDIIQIKDIHKVDINKPVEAIVLFDEKIDILLRIVNWYKHSPCNDTLEYKPILEEQSKLFRFIHKLLNMLLGLLAITVITLLVVLSYQAIVS